MTKLTYIYDTLCGWCFVAHPEVMKLRAALPSGVEFRTLHANLFTPEHPFSLNDQSLAMVRNVGQMVAPAKTGARMSDAYISFLETPGLVYESGLSARAAAAADKLDASRAFAFEMAYQQAIFEQGADFRDPEVVGRVWTAVGGNGGDMLAALTDSNTETLQQIKKNDAQKLLARAGASGTPTLVLEHQGQLKLIEPHVAKDALAAVMATTGLKDSA